MRICYTDWTNKRSSEWHSPVTRTSLEPSIFVFIHCGMYRCNDTNTLFTPYPYTSHPNFLTQNLLLRIWYTDWIENRSSQRNLPITRTSIESTINVINTLKSDLKIHTRCSLPIHILFIQLSLYFLSRILYKNQTNNLRKKVTGHQWNHREIYRGNGTYRLFRPYPYPCP